MTLPKLPDLSFFDNDPQKMIANVHLLYKNLTGVDVQKSSGEYLFITTISALIALQRHQYEKEFKSNFLYYATGEKLDHIGASRKTPRLEKQGASTMLEFELSAVRPEAVIIPAGIRTTADNVIFFATDRPLVINAGASSGSVSATSLQTGIGSNNIEIGAISMIVDPVPFVASVKNIEITLGGRDDEPDEAYRERIYHAPSVFSIAGPRKAYEYLTKAVSSAVGEVTVDSEREGTVQIYPLLTNGEVPNQSILNSIENALSAETVRPLTDFVEVKPPVIRNYDLELKFYIYKEQAGNVDNLRSAVVTTVNEWILWQRLKIGRDINLSKLISEIMRTGVKRVEIISPSFTVINKNELAVNTSTSILFGGLEDE